MQSQEEEVTLTLTQRIRLEILGITPTIKRKLPGWSGELQFYAFNAQNTA